MVTFQILSDIHIETRPYINIDKLLYPSADVLILAGDIGRIHKIKELEAFIKAMCAKFDLVVYILGNHEYYNEKKYSPKTIEQLFSDAKKMEKKMQNLKILNRNSIIIEDICISGCTLWSNIEIDPSNILRINNITKQQYLDMHNKDLNYIKTMINYCKNKKLKLLVVTHHCPTFLYQNRKSIKNDLLKSLYCSNLDYLLDKEKIHTWICGHVHINFDVITENGTRLVSNQKGKYKEYIKNFNYTKVINIL
jgi:predicted phosphodiesterase